jgi:hypothetical protein
MRIGRSIHPLLSDAHSFDALSLFHCRCAATCLLRRHRCITPPPAAAARRLDEAETEGAWVRRWDAVAGGAGADWATCLRLLERAAADVALDGCGGRCLFVPGGELNEIKKIENKRLCLIWPPTGNSNTTTNQKHTHATQEVNVTRFDR